MAVKHQLRKVAGVYWLLDISQSGTDYRKSLPLNETAAVIWKMLTEGKSREEVAEVLCDGDMGIKDEVSADIEEFIRQMENAGADYREELK